MNWDNQPGFIPPHGGYQDLLSYQKAQIVFDATVYFCNRVNVIIGLIKVTNYLLDQQLKALEQAFLKNGGLREAMTRARVAIRSNQRRPQ